jgi:hypothetical protein
VYAFLGRTMRPIPLAQSHDVECRRNWGLAEACECYDLSVNHQTLTDTDERFLTIVYILDWCRNTWCGRLCSRTTASIMLASARHRE